MLAVLNRKISLRTVLLLVIATLFVEHFVFLPSHLYTDAIKKQRNAPILHDLNVVGSLQDSLTNKSLIYFEKKQSVNNSNSLSLKSIGADSNKDDDFLKRVRVLCWIMTSPETLMSKAFHIKNTWGSRCDHTLYMSSVKNETFPAIGLNVREGRYSLFYKTQAAFKYIYENEFTWNFDWFLKADDDTYVIVENLKYFLRDKNASEPVYYGHNFKKYMKNGYMSGGAGYVLSRRALEKFVTIALDDREICGRDLSVEDVAIGHCLQSVGVIAGDSRDALNRSRFIPMTIGGFINGRMAPWYSSYAKYKVQKGRKCCSDYLISCHYVKPDQMYEMDYLVYHLRPALPNSDHTYHVNKTRLTI